MRRKLVFNLLCILLLTALVSASGGCSGDRRAHKLNRAIDAGNSKAVDALLDDETFDVKATEDSGATLLFHAMEVQNKAIYVKLLEKGASPNYCDNSGTCVMNEAAREPDSFWLFQALAHGGDPDVLNTGNRHAPNRTPLFYALNKRLVKNTIILIDAGADVNHRDSFGLTPLRVAGGNGEYESIVAMLEAGADPKQTDKHGHSFVDWFKNNDDETDEYFVRKKDQLVWLRKAKEILIKRGLIKNGAEE